MERIFHMDPSSMAVWYGLKWYQSSDVNTRLLEVAAAALSGDHDLAVEKVAAYANNGDELYGEALGVLSSIWHEQRHFVDYLLTNYGQFRIRQFQSLYANLPEFILRAAKTGEPLRFPFSSNVGPQRLVRQWPEPSAELAQQVRDIRGRERIETMDRRAETVSGGMRVALGGHALLESLAFMSEIAAVTDEFGEVAAVEAQLALPDNGIVMTDYMWLFWVARSVGIQFQERSRQDVIMVSNGISRLGPLIYGALASRIGYPDSTRDNGNPRFRLIALLAELKKTNLLSEDMPVESAWHIVNQTCKALWGKTAIESMRDDIARGDDMSDKYAAASGRHAGWRFAADCQAARKQLFKILLDDPAAILDPQRFRYGLLRRLQTPAVFADSSARFLSEKTGDFLFGPSYGQDAPARLRAHLWAVAQRQRIPPRNWITLRDREAWRYVVQLLSPIAKLAMRGRTGPAWGPELAFAEMSLRGAGVSVAIDPMYARQVDLVDGATFWKVSRLQRAECSGCDATINANEGQWFSPWEMRASRQRVEWARARFGKWGCILQERDWTEWLLCAHCAAEVQALQQYDSPLVFGPPFDVEN